MHASTTLHLLHILQNMNTCDDYSTTALRTHTTLTTKHYTYTLYCTIECTSQIMNKLLGEIAEIIGPIRAALGTNNIQVS
jgi:hypothetical protein